MGRTSLRIEKQHARQAGGLVAGVDEVGRGALAGPITVGVVVVGAGTAPAPPGLADSKELSPAQRLKLVEPIKAWCVDWAIGHAESDEVDGLGVTASLTLALSRALESLRHDPVVLLIDGNVNWAPPGVAAVTRVKADRDCSSVAAASVLAKVHRDHVLREWDSEFPGYGWSRNVGYGSKEHIGALRTLGLTPRHRKSWCAKFVHLGP